MRPRDTLEPETSPVPRAAQHLLPKRSADLLIHVPRAGVHPCLTAMQSPGTGGKETRPSRHCAHSRWTTASARVHLPLGQGCYLGLLPMTAGRHWVILRSPSWFGEQAIYRKVWAHESEARGWAGTEERQGHSAGLAPK